MNRPASDAGSRCLLGELAGQEPAFASWLAASQARACFTLGSVRGTPAFCNAKQTRPVANPSLVVSKAVESFRFHPAGKSDAVLQPPSGACFSAIPLTIAACSGPVSRFGSPAEAQRRNARFNSD